MVFACQPLAAKVSRVAISYIFLRGFFTAIYAKTLATSLVSGSNRFGYQCKLLVSYARESESS